MQPGRHLPPVLGIDHGRARSPLTMDAAGATIGSHGTDDLRQAAAPEPSRPRPGDGRIPRNPRPSPSRAGLLLEAAAGRRSDSTWRCPRRSRSGRGPRGRGRATVGFHGTDDESRATGRQAGEGAGSLARFWRRPHRPRPARPRRRLRALKARKVLAASAPASRFRQPRHDPLRASRVAGGVRNGCFPVPRLGRQKEGGSGSPGCGGRRVTTLDMDFGDLSTAP